MTIEIGTGPMPQMPGPGRTCSCGSCPNAPEWQVGLMLYGVLQGWKYPVPGETGYYVCDAHRPDVKIEDIVTEAGWAQICEGFRRARRLEPTRELTKLRFLPILKLGGPA